MLDISLTGDNGENLCLGEWLYPYAFQMFSMQLIAALIVFINMCQNSFFAKVSQLEGNQFISDELRSKLTKLMTTSYLNTTVITLLVYV